MTAAGGGNDEVMRSVTGIVPEKRRANDENALEIDFATMDFKSAFNEFIQWRILLVEQQAKRNFSLFVGGLAKENLGAFILGVEWVCSMESREHMHDKQEAKDGSDNSMVVDEGEQDFTNPIDRRKFNLEDDQASLKLKDSNDETDAEALQIIREVFVKLLLDSFGKLSISCAFSVSLLLTPLCCDDIHDVTPHVSALAEYDKLVSEPMVIEN
ncbi:hypothetical protein Tco_0421770 [Tanacetum coccineum]